MDSAGADAGGGREGGEKLTDGHTGLAPPSRSLDHNVHIQCPGQRRNGGALLLLLLRPQPSFPLASLGGGGVAAVWMPLHVPDASDGLHLWAAGSELIEMLEVALLQKVLAAAVAGELVPHPAVEGGRKDSVSQPGLNREAPKGRRSQQQTHN